MPSLSDLEARIDETSPLLNYVNDSPERSIPGAFPSETEDGFVIGNFEINNSYAQRILDKSSAHRQIWTRLIPEFKETAINGAVAAATTTGTHLLSKALIGTNNSGGTVEMIKMNSIAAAVATMTQPIRAVLETLAFPPKGEALAAATMRTALTRANKELQPLLAQIHPKAKDGIQATIDEFMDKIQDFKPGNPYNLTSGEAKKRWKGIIDLISLPLKTENTYQHNIGGDLERAQAIDAKQTAVVSSYPEEIQESLNDVINAHRFASINPDSRQPFHIFEGPPAVGKTFAVREMCKALNATLIEATENDLADFLGVPRRDKQVQESNFDYDLWQWIRPEPKIWTQLRKVALNSNVVLFADELSFEKNPELLPAFKRWMTGEDPIFPNSREVPGCPKFTVIAASNENIYKQLGDEAAQSRVMTYVKFPNWPPNLLTKRAVEYLEQKKQEARGKFKDESIQKTFEDVMQLLNPMLATVNRYDIGTFSLRDVQMAIDNTTKQLLLRNDLKQQYILSEVTEKVLQSQEKLLENRGISVIRILGTGSPVEDPTNRNLILKAREIRANLAEQTLQMLRTDGGGTNQNETVGIARLGR
jgi:hypothetical protein